MPLTPEMIAELDAARVDGMKAERAAVVAWLRNEGTLQIDTGYDAGVYGGQGMHFAADAIERDDHLKV